MWTTASGLLSVRYCSTPCIPARVRLDRTEIKVTKSNVSINTNKMSVNRSGVQECPGKSTPLPRHSWDSSNASRWGTGVPVLGQLFDFLIRDFQFPVRAGPCSVTTRARYGPDLSASEHNQVPGRHDDCQDTSAIAASHPITGSPVDQERLRM